MNTFNITLVAFFLASLGFNASVNAQCGSDAQLNNAILESEYYVYGMDGSGPHWELFADTDYRVRIITTGEGVCQVVGGGCASADAPTHYTSEYENGCTINGSGSQEAMQQPGGSKIADFYITTNPPSTFGGQIVLSLRFYGTRQNICGYNDSPNVMLVNP